MPEHKMSIMNKTGDLTINWDSENPAEVEHAQKMFADFSGKGYAFYAKNPDQPNEDMIVQEFNPNLNSLVAVPQAVGG